MGSSHFKVKNTHKKQATAASKRRIIEDDADAREPQVDAVEARAPEVAAAAPEVKVVKKRADTPSDACLSGSFYTSPTIGSTHPALYTPLLIAWDASLACLPGPLVDIYLYAPHSAMPRIHLWKGVKVEEGKVEVELMPRWWNATQSEELQIQIVQQNTPPFLSPLPAGPVFTATYTAPSDGSLPLEADTSVVDIGETDLAAQRAQSSSSSKGKIAVGVLIPLLVIALGVAGYLRWKRRKGKDERKKWTEAVDKRMSTISVDWKSVTHVGAQEAIRKSFAANRASTFSFNGGDGNEKGSGSGSGSEIDREQRRPGVGLRNPSGLSNGERVSRVSFANDPRPSSESRRTKAFRDSYVPPVPSLPPVSTSPLASNALAYNPSDYEAAGEGALSPTQTEGAFSLTPEAIRARIAAGRARSASNASVGKSGGYGEEMDVGDIGPALSMMRTGQNPAAASSDDLLFAVPATPQPAYSSPLAAQSSFSSPMASSFNTTAPLNVHHTSSFSAYGGTTTNTYGTANTYGGYGNGNGAAGQGIERIASPVTAMPAMQAMPAAVMSPDEMLRAYAERKKSMSAVPATGVSSSSASHSISHGATSSLSQNPLGAGAGGAGGIAYPAPAAGAGRTLFNGSTVTPQGTGERKERTPSLGFAPGEYDPNFTFEK